MQIQPYLFFDGRCEEAIEFYRKCLGAELLMLMRFNESPDPLPPGMLPPGAEAKVMHAALRIGDSTVLASDGDCSGRTKMGGFSLSLSIADEAAADRVFAALGEGGTVKMPMGRTFFARRFGMLDDRFGVGWMVIVEK